MSVGEKISREELVTELKRLHSLLGDVPSRSDLKNYSGISPTAYETEFGTYSNAVSEILNEKTKQDTNKIPKSKLINHLEQLADSLGKTPTCDDMDEFGNYCASAYTNNFGSWIEAIKVSNLDIWQMPSGEEHPSWKGGHESEDYGPNWNKQRQKALKRDGYECTVCGISNSDHKEMYGAGLHVHHIQKVRHFDDYKKQNRLDNLVTLCVTCHSDWEGIPLRPL